MLEYLVLEYFMPEVINCMFYVSITFNCDKGMFNMDCFGGDFTVQKEIENCECCFRYEFSGDLQPKE